MATIKAVLDYWSISDQSQLWLTLVLWQTHTMKLISTLNVFGILLNYEKGNCVLITQLQLYID